MLDLGVLVARATLDTAQFDTGYLRTVSKMRGLSDQALKAAEGILRLDGSLAGAGKSATDAAAGMDRAAKATASSSTAEQKATATAERHAAALKQVAGIMSTVAESDQRVRSATLRVTAAQERLNAIQESGAATTRQLASAQATLIGAERSLATAQKATYATTGRSESGLRRMIGTAAELGLVFGGIEIAKKAIEFVSAGKDLTTALNGVQAAARATDGQMVKVRAEALNLGRDMKVPKATAVDAADAINDLVRAGMKLPRAMAAARPALLLAAAAQVDTADAARYLGDTLDDFGLKATEAVHVANSLAGAATSAGGGLSDMFTALSYAGPYARAVGVDVDSVVASIAELAKSGIQGSRAGTGIARMLQSLANPSEKAAGALADLGVVAWDTRGRFVGLKSLYGQLHDAQERMGVDTERFTRDVSRAFGARAATAVAVFAHRGIDGYNQFAARVASGDVQKYADLMNRGVSADLAALEKRFTAAGIAVWDRLEPAAKSASHWFAYDLPRDVGVTMQILGPLIHMVGTGLAGAWHLASGAIGVAAHALGGIGHFLADHETLVRVVGTAVLGMWAAYKGYRIAVFAMDAISTGLINGRANVARWRAGFTESLTGVQAQTATTSAVMRAEFAQIEAAALEAAAAQDRAAAQEAVAYADMVAASDNATATMVANAAAQAVAAQTAATESAAAAAEAVASAEAASAAIATAGEEATIGWSSMLGPIGLVVGALAAVGLGFLHAGGDAQKASQLQQTYNDSLKQTLDTMAKVNIAQTIKNLHDQQAFGLLVQLHQAGSALSLTYGDLAVGVNGSDRQFQALQTTLQGVIEAHTKTVKTGRNTYTVMDDTGKAAQDLSGKLGSVRDALYNERDATIIQNKAMGQAAHGARDYGKAVTHTKGWIVAAAQANIGYSFGLDRVTSSLDTTVSSEHRLGDASKVLKGILNGLAGTLNKAAAAVAWQQGLRDLTKTIKDNKGAIDGHKASALADRAAFISQAQQIVQNAQTMRDNGASVKTVTGYLKDHIAQLKDAAVKAGGDKDKVDALTRSLHLVPSLIRAEIRVDTSTALGNVAYLAGQIKALGGAAGATTATGMSYTGPNPAPPKKKPGKAAGGGLPEGWSSVGEGGPGARPELVYKDGSNVHVFSTPQSKAIVAATGMAAPGFAGGTVRSQVLSQVRDPRVRLAMLMAPFLEGGGRNPLGAGGWGVGDSGTSFGPYQIHLPAHPGVSAREATDPRFAVRYMSGAYRAAVRSVPGAMWRDSPAMAARLAIFRAERPTSIYGASAAAAAYRAVRGIAGGGQGHGHSGGGHGGGSGGGSGGSGGGGGGGGVATLPGAGDNPPVVQRVTGGDITGGTSIDKVPMRIYRVGKGFGWNGSYYAKHKDAVAARRQALQQAAAQRLAPGYHTGHRTPTTITDRIGGAHGATGVAKILTDNKPTAVKAMRDLAKAVNTAWNLKGVEKSLDNARTQLKDLRGDFANMRQYQAGVTSTYAGNFDPTQFGTIGGLIGGLGAETRRDTRIAAQIRRLRHEHLNKGYLNQLVTGGQTDLISMLAGGSQRDINRVNTALGDWRSSLTAIGRGATLNRFGKSLADEQRLVEKQRKHIDRLVDRVDTLTNRIRDLANSVEDLTGRPVEITMDGKVVARSTGAHHARAITHRGRKGSQTG